MRNINLKIVTFGVFDLFHYGHLRLFKNIKRYFGIDSFLSVCVQDSNFVKKFKPNCNLVYTTNERVEMISGLKFVDEVLVYETIEDIKQLDFDVWVKGPDQSHKGFLQVENWCRENQKDVFIMPRTIGFSSSDLRKDIKVL